METRDVSRRTLLKGGGAAVAGLTVLPLPKEHSFPLRLIAPGWYGVANVKWLRHIEVIDHPFRGRFMARDYVTFREERRGDETVWTFTMVTHEGLKSAPAKVTRDRRRRQCPAGVRRPLNRQQGDVLGEQRADHRRARIP